MFYFSDGDLAYLDYVDSGSLPQKSLRRCEGLPGVACRTLLRRSNESTVCWQCERRQKMLTAEDARRKKRRRRRLTAGAGASQAGSEAYSRY